jgi:hypothetical protein
LLSRDPRSGQPPRLIRDVGTQYCGDEHVLDVSICMTEVIRGCQPAPAAVPAVDVRLTQSTVRVLIG